MKSPNGLTIKYKNPWVVSSIEFGDFLDPALGFLFFYK